MKAENGGIDESLRVERILGGIQVRITHTKLMLKQIRQGMGIVIGRRNVLALKCAGPGFGVCTIAVGLLRG